MGASESTESEAMSSREEVENVVDVELKSEGKDLPTSNAPTNGTESTTKIPIDATHYNPLVVVSQSKALEGLFTKLRDVNTSGADFVKYSKRAMAILAEDAMAEFPSKRITIQTPCGPYCDGTETIDLSTVCAVSIVRSGDALLEVVRAIVPEISVGKILIQRDESHPDKTPKLFYSKLPKHKKYVLLCDPMLATGGSAIMALDVLTVKYKISARNIIFANMICCPEGLQALKESYPRVKIVTAMVDSHLNADKFIVPGLGDYGDRYFGTEE
jgi:uracil phosphoribosyltransferase